MRCSKCGTDNQDKANFCFKCGTTFNPYTAPTTVVGSSTQPTTNGMAIASLILGIVGLLLGWLILFIPNILAIVFGHIASSQIKHAQGAQTGRGMAIAGMVMGYIIVAVGFIGFLAAIAIPAYQGYTTQAALNSIDDKLYAQVSAHVQQYHRLPEDFSQLGASLAPTEKQLLQSIHTDTATGAITISFTNRIKNGKIIYVPTITDSKVVNWVCQGIELKSSSLPRRCQAASP
jgi:hypothetical protein